MQVQASHLQQWLDDEPRGPGEQLPPSLHHITNQPNKYFEAQLKIQEEKKLQKEKKAQEISDDILVYMVSFIPSLFVSCLPLDLRVDSRSLPHHLSLSLPLLLAHLPHLLSVSSHCI